MEARAFSKARDYFIFKHYLRKQFPGTRGFGFGDAFAWGLLECSLDHLEAWILSVGKSLGFLLICPGVVEGKNSG